MTTLHSNITAANYPEVVALAEQALDAAGKRRDELKAVYDRRTAPKTDFDNDPAIVSGIRRTMSGSMRQRQQATSDRDLDAWKAYRQAQDAFEALERRVERLRASAPVPYTEEALRAAAKVRTGDGWYLLRKVNAKTVGVDAGFPWPLNVKRERVLEVK